MDLIVDITMTHHHVVRRGAHWVCVHCPGRWPYPSPVPPEAADTCTPRDFADTAPKD